MSAEAATQIAQDMGLSPEDRARLLDVAQRGAAEIAQAARAALDHALGPGGGRGGPIAGALMALDEAVREDSILRSLPNDAARAEYLAGGPARGNPLGVGGLDDEEAPVVGTAASAASEAWLARQDALRAAERRFAAARGDAARAAAWAEIELLRKAR